MSVTATLDLVRPTARAGRLVVVAGGPAVGLALLSLLSLVKHPVALLLLLVGLMMVVPFGYLFDDVAADVVAASPSTLARRRLTRLALGAPILASGWALAMARGDYLEGYEDLPLGALTAEILAFACLTLAAAAVAARRGDATPGLSAAIFLMMVVALLFVLRQAVPSSWPIPELQPDLHYRRWWWVTAASVAVVVWASLDPAVRWRGALRRSGRR